MLDLIQDVKIICLLLEALLVARIGQELFPYQARVFLLESGKMKQDLKDATDLVV